MTTIVAAAGGGNWGTGATWVGGVAPTAADDVQLDASSGSVTITANAACRSLDCTGYTGTLRHMSSCMLTIGDGTAGAGSVALKLVAGMTYTRDSNSSSAITFASTSATVQTIDLGGQTVSQVTFDGAGGSWQLVSSFTSAAGGTLTHTRGTLDTNGQAVTILAYSSNNSNSRVLTLGASVVTIFDGGYRVWRVNGTGFTLNAGTSQIILTGASARFTGGGKTYYDLLIRGTGTTDIEDGANTFHDLERSNAAAVTLTLPTSSFTALTGDFVASGTSGNLVTINSSSPGSAATLSKTTGTVAIDYVSIRDSTATGGASFYAGTHSTDVSGNTGWVFTAPPAPGSPPRLLLLGVGA